MGKHFRTKQEDDQYEEYRPGCMWGVLHALDYHHWHRNLKKILPHYRTHDEQRQHAKGNLTKKTRRNVLEYSEVQNLLEADASDALVNQTCTKNGTSKRSIVSRMKKLIAEEMYKEEEGYRKIPSNFSSRRKLQRTYAFHRLEHPDHGFGGSTKPKLPFVFPGNSGDTSSTRLKDQTLKKTIKTNRGNSSNDQFEYDDVLEIFEVNKELFLNILKNTDDGFAAKASKCKGILTKSGSFPVADKSCNRNFRPSKLEHKYNEIWTPLPKGENLLAGTKIANDHQCTKTDTLMTAESGESELDRETGSSSIGSAQELDKRWSDEVVIDLLNKIKQRIENEAYDTSKDSLNHFRRTSSLNESVDRYARLFDHSLINRDAKLHVSKSLRLSNEYEIRSSGHASRSSRRIRSLSNLDPYCYPLPNEETCNANLSEIQCRTATDENPKFEIDRPDEPKSAGVPIMGEADMEEVTVESNSYEEREITCSEVVDADLPQPSPVSIFESCSQIPGDSGCKSNNIGEKEFSVGRIDTVNFDDDTDFNYVRAILELSGFLKNGQFGTWHLFDQPLNPSLFEEVEAHWLHEVKSSEEDINACFHHLLLFDMINEVLLQIFDTSFSYYPRALSSNCRGRPMPVGHCVLEEVWKSINKSLSLSSEPEQSLDNLIARDFVTDDWMNLQLETENVALELEDLIFDELFDEEIFGELLDEAICS